MTTAAQIPQPINRGLYNLLLYGMALPYAWPNIMYNAYVRPLLNMQPSLMPLEEARGLSQNYDATMYPEPRFSYTRDMLGKTTPEQSIRWRRSMERNGLTPKDSADDVAEFYGY